MRIGIRAAATSSNDDDADTDDAVSSSRDARFANEAERQRAIARLSPPKPRRTAAATAKRFGTKNAFGGATRSTTKGDDINRARLDAVRRKAERREREARGIMDGMRRAIEEAPVCVDGFATMGVAKQAKVASELVAYLCDERGFGTVESVFGVVAWMSDTIDDAAMEAEGAARAARGDEGDGAKTSASDEETPTAARGSLSAWLRQYFTIDVIEREDRKEIQVDASVEFLAMFILLLYASSRFGASLVEFATHGGPIDPLLR